MTLIDAARLRAHDVTITMGSIGVRLRTYGGDGEDLLSPVADARVIDEATGKVALFHATTAIHGLIDLPAGPRRLRVEDPAGRWLPRVIDAVAPERVALARALEDGTTLPADPGPTRIDVAMFPTVLRSFPPAESVAWGTVSRGGQPVPFAFVRLEVDGRWYRGATDASGVWQIWLRGLPVSEGPPPAASLSAAAPLDPDPWLPPSFAELSPGTLGFLSVYEAATTVAAAIQPGRRTRLPDLPLP